MGILGLPFRPLINSGFKAPATLRFGQASPDGPDEDTLTLLRREVPEPPTAAQKREMMAPHLEAMGVAPGNPRPNAEEIDTLLAFNELAPMLDGKGRRTERDSIINQLRRSMLARFPRGTSLAGIKGQPGEGLLKAGTEVPEDARGLIEKWGRPALGGLEEYSDEDLDTIFKAIPLLRALDAENVFDENSMTNQLYRALFPRQFGVVLYGGALKGDGAEAYMAKAREFTRELGEAGFFGVTGGGPVFMEACARGFLDAGSHTMGSNIRRFNDSDVNVHREVTMYHGVPARIGAIGGYDGRAASVVCFPGGVGTNREFWGKLEDFIFGVTPYPTRRVLIMVDLNPRFTEEVQNILERMIGDGRVKPEVRRYMRWVHTPEEALAVLRDPTIPVTSGRPLDHVAV